MKNGEIRSIVETLPEIVALPKWLPEGCGDPEASRKLQGGRKEQVEPLLLAPEFLSGGSFSQQNGEIGSIVETLPEIHALPKWLPEGCGDPEASPKLQGGRKEQVEPLLRAPNFSLAVLFR